MNYVGLNEKAKDYIKGLPEPEMYVGMIGNDGEEIMFRKWDIKKVPAFSNYVYPLGVFCEKFSKNVEGEIFTHIEVSRKDSWGNEISGKMFEWEKKDMQKVQMDRIKHLLNLVM